MKDGVGARQWSKVTEDTGTGNPPGRPRKGWKFFRACEQHRGFLVDVAKADPNNMYE